MSCEVLPMLIELELAGDGSRGRIVVDDLNEGGGAGAEVSGGLVACRDGVAADGETGRAVLSCAVLQVDRSERCGAIQKSD